MIKNKKGHGLSLNFLIIAILAVVTLILVVLFFTGGFETIATKIKGVEQVSSQEIALLKASCKTACSFGNQKKYENPGFDKKYIDAGYKDCSHNDLGKGKYSEKCGKCTGTATSGDPCGSRITASKCKDGCKWKAN